MQVKHMCGGRSKICMRTLILLLLSIGALFQTASARFWVDLKGNTLNINAFRTENGGKTWCNLPAWRLAKGQRNGYWHLEIVDGMHHFWLKGLEELLENAISEGEQRLYYAFSKDAGESWCEGTIHFPQRIKAGGKWELGFWKENPAKGEMKVGDEVWVTNDLGESWSRKVEVMPGESADRGGCIKCPPAD